MAGAGMEAKSALLQLLKYFLGFPNWRYLFRWLLAKLLVAWRRIRSQVLRKVAHFELNYCLPAIPPVLLAVIWRYNRLRNDELPAAGHISLASLREGSAGALTLALQGGRTAHRSSGDSDDGASDHGSESSCTSFTGGGSLSNLGASIAEASRLAALAQRRQRKTLVRSKSSPAANTAASEEEMWTLHPFHEHRWRLLTGEIRNLETMQPFAMLRLRVNEAKLAEETVDITAQSSLYAQIYVNDVLQTQSHGAACSHNPFWHIDTSVGIHSPLSVVRVAIKSHELMAKDCVIGFVEFRAAELLTNDLSVSGWFELRRKEKLHGTAKGRFKQHVAVRDENAAGEVHLNVRCSVLPSPQTERERARHLSWWRLVLEAMFLPSLLLQRNLDDEWYAYCFPKPDLGYMDQCDGWLHLKDVKELHNQLLEVHTNFMDQVVRPFLCLCWYVVSWQCWPLSFCALLHWWLCCLWPVYLLPSLPLWAAVWLSLLRDLGWRRELLLHEATAPLNAEGFEMITSRNNSEQIYTWLCRLIEARCGTVKDDQELREFTKLTFQDGHPALSFGMLLDELSQRPWISWKRRRQRRDRLGHVLELWGASSYQRDCTWCCNGPEDAGCPHGSRGHRALHLGVTRYHCATCGVDLCESCVFGGKGRKEGRLLNMVPVVGFESVKRFVFEAGILVRMAQKGMVAACSFVDRALDPDEDSLALAIYFLCAIASVALACLSAIPDLGRVQVAIRTLAWLAVGTAVFTQNATFARRMRTVCQANWYFLRVRELRRRGGCANWAFLSLDAPPSPVPS